MASDQCMFPVPVAARSGSSTPSSSIPPCEPGFVVPMAEHALDFSDSISCPLVQAGKAVEPVTDFLPGSTHEIRSILIIQNAELEDSGTYVCNVSEGYHEKTDRKDITVRVIGALLPTHPKPPNHVAAQAGCPRVTPTSLHTASSSLPSSPLPLVTMAKKRPSPQVNPTHFLASKHPKSPTTAFVTLYDTSGCG